MKIQEIRKKLGAITKKIGMLLEEKRKLDDEVSDILEDKTIDALVKSSMKLTNEYGSLVTKNPGKSKNSRDEFRSALAEVTYNYSDRLGVGYGDGEDIEIHGPIKELLDFARAYSIPVMRD